MPKLHSETMVIKSYTTAKILRYKMDSIHKLIHSFKIILTFIYGVSNFVTFFYKTIHQSSHSFCGVRLYLQLVKGKTERKHLQIKINFVGKYSHCIFTASHVSRAIKINQNVMWTLTKIAALPLLIILLMIIIIMCDLKN